MNIGGTEQYFTKWGFPMPQVTAWVAVIFELVGGLDPKPIGLGA